MFSLDIVDTDKFLEMPATTQSLYFHLGMRADDDGFVSSPKKIASMVNCGNDDLKLLIAKEYLIPFDNGIVVITNWKVNNWIRLDRKQGTRFKSELSMLTLKNDTYCMLSECQPIDNQLTTACHTEVSIEKNSVEKNSIKKSSSSITTKKSYIDFFENNFHMPSSYEIQILNSFLDDGISEEVIIMAMERAVENNVRNIKYVKAILQKWLENNVMTPKDVITERVEFERNKSIPKDVEMQAQYKFLE